jgi:hypothetical protein
MVTHGSKILGVLALALPLACDGESEQKSDGGAGSSGRASAGRGGGAGTGGAGGKAANGGGGGSAGTSRGGRAGAGGNDSTDGSGGRAGSKAIGGTSNGGSAAMGGNAGESEGGEAGAAGDDTLTWDIGGYIAENANSFGIQGSWFFETDCADAMLKGLPCTMPDPSLSGPDFLPGWSLTKERVCVKGTAPQVINDPMTGMPAYLEQWGARLGFELNSSGTSRGPFDAEAQGIKGFSFDIITTTLPPLPADVRVNVHATNNQGDEHFVTAALPSASFTLLFDDALQGVWVTAPVLLDTTELTAVSFQIYTNSTAAKLFDFCVSNVHVIR